MATAPSTSGLKAAEIGGRLRRLRKQRRLTQTELARQIGIQQSDLSRMENGEYRVSLDSLFRILGVLEVEISDFFDDQARRQEAAASSPRPLAHEDMQTLHLLRQLSPESRREVMEFLEFKVRKEQTESRATKARRSNGASG